MKIMRPINVAAQCAGRIWIASLKAGRRIEYGAAATLRTNEGEETQMSIIGPGNPRVNEKDYKQVCKQYPPCYKEDKSKERKHHILKYRDLTQQCESRPWLCIYVLHVQ